MEIIAHRGASHLAPENSLSAFRLAWKENADGIELDIRMTADGHIVVMHDADTGRTSDMTLDVFGYGLAQLKKADIGSWKSPEYKGETVPELSDVLIEMPEGKSVYIEVKVGAEIIPVLTDILSRFSNLSGNSVIIGFSFEAMSLIKETLPDYRCLWLVEFGYNVPEYSEKSKKEVFDNISSASLDGIASKGDMEICRLIAPDIKKNNLFWNIWTVDDPASALELYKLEPDSITTNRPAFIRSVLDI